MAKSTKVKGQSKVEFLKNYTRVKDIITKSAGSKGVQRELAQRQANAITDEHKCINRAMAAKELKNDEIFEVFFRRAYELWGNGPIKGSIKQEYREYVISNILS